MTLISIIIATYNRADFIATTLNSILNQSYENWEVIIVDDGGNDNTFEVLQPFLRDIRFSFYKRPLNFPKGCPGSRNFGLSKAKGDFVWFFDDDDIAHPHLLQTCAGLLREEGLDFFRFGRTIFYDPEEISFATYASPETVHINKSRLKDLITGHLPFNSCQVIWRRSSLGEKRFKGDIIYADDWEFYSRLLADGLEGISISEILLFARKHPGSATNKYNSRDKTILQSVTLATFRVIDIAKRENILDREVFRYFYRQALLFRSYSIVEYLLERVDIKASKKMKYRIGFYFYPVIKRFFYLRSKF